VSASGRLFFGAELGSAGLELGFEAHPAVSSRDGEGQGFRRHLLLGSVAACARIDQLSLCAVSKWGSLRATGLGVDRPGTGRGTLGQIGPRLAYLLPFGEHLGLVGRWDSAYLLTPWTVRLDDADVWTVPRFSSVVGIDLAARFP
jgi:hypothetical protein